MMTDDEIRDYLEQHTLWGASVRFERSVHELGAALKATAPIRLFLAVAEFVLRLITAIITRLDRLLR